MYVFLFNNTLTSRFFICLIYQYMRGSRNYRQGGGGGGGGPGQSDKKTLTTFFFFF